jgi:hypothetical protein
MWYPYLGDRHGSHAMPTTARTATELVEAMSLLMRLPTPSYAGERSIDSITPNTNQRNSMWK